MLSFLGKSETKLQLEKERKLGAEAREALRNPALQEAFEALQDSLLTQMRLSPLMDETQHSRLVITFQLLHGIRQALEQYVETGNLAESSLQEMIENG